MIISIEDALSRLVSSLTNRQHYRIIFCAIWIVAADNKKEFEIWVLLYFSHTLTLKIVNICESQYIMSLNNGNILNITDCTSSYAILTSSLTDLLRGLMIFTLDNLFYVYIYIFIGIARYSIIYTTSGPMV
jgi:hypothetical protein